MASAAELGDKLAKLTIAQAVELKNYLKEKYEIEPAAGGAVMMARPRPLARRRPKAAEPTEFNVILEPGFDAAKKINIIKVVREMTGQGLAEAKATVEGAPKTIKESVGQEDRRGREEEAGRGRREGHRQAGGLIAGAQFRRTSRNSARAGRRLQKKCPGGVDFHGPPR